MLSSRLVAGLLAVALIAALPHSIHPALAASAAEINRDANSSLAKLYEKVPEARTLSGKAVAMLVFPSIVKAGFLFGAQYGEGVLREKGKNVGYYNTVAASYGLQAGVQIADPPALARASARRSLGAGNSSTAGPPLTLAPRV